VDDETVSVDAVQGEVVSCLVAVVVIDISLLPSFMNVCCYFLEECYVSCHQTIWSGCCYHVFSVFLSLCEELHRSTLQITKDLL